MSMLAEPRKKKRYNLVPRGKALYEDENRFGTKMLKKMGWSQGSGLGAREEGSTEFVRVRYKNDAEGLGFEDRDDQWTQHESKFNGLLQTLNGEKPNDGHEVDDVANQSDESMNGLGTTGLGFSGTSSNPSSNVEKKSEKLKDKFSGESLEAKSKHSRARVHYKKFTQGKDLARYSEKDLANIFGKKAGEDVTVVPDEQEQPPDKEVPANFAGVPTYSAGVSVGDYFKQKMQKIKKRLRRNSDGANEDGEQESAKENRAETPTNANVDDQDSMEASSRKKKRKTDMKDKEVSENAVNMELVPHDDTETMPATSTKKSKKKSKHKNKDEMPATEEEIQLKKSEHLEVVRQGLVAAISEEESDKMKKEKLSPKKTKKSKRKAKDQVTVTEADDSKASCSTNVQTAIKRLNELNTYRISKFSAEKFASLNFDGFKGSNLNQIDGYGLNPSTKLEVVDTVSSNNKIRYFWDTTLNNKYKDATPKNVFVNYVKEARRAYREKKRLPKLDLKALKRKNAFHNPN